jgi:serine/threonine protein kinase
VDIRGWGKVRNIATAEIINPIMPASIGKGESISVDTVMTHNLKGYELRERIGAGGFGAVYRAYQSTVGREVAIKIILPGLANQPEFIRRFEGEAQIVACLR